MQNNNAQRTLTPVAGRLLLLLMVWLLAGCAPAAEQTQTGDSILQSYDLDVAAATTVAIAPRVAATAEPPPPTLPADAAFQPGDSLPAADASADAVVVDEQGYRELGWEDLVPPGFRPEDIMAKYADQLNQFQDGDAAAMDIYNQMQQEFMNAPINDGLNDTLIKLPGFIAPLDYQDDEITEFLLVPYFGACIHVPPPPVNQTVHITAAPDNGISLEESYYPVWIMGTLKTEGATTDIGVAGYSVQDAVIVPYTYSD